MGDSETVLAQASATYPSGDPMDVTGGSLDAGGSVPTTEFIDNPATGSSAGETVSPSGNLDGSNVDAAALSSIHQEAPSSITYEAEEKFDGSLNAGPNQVSGYDSALNSNGVSDGDGAAALNVSENGVVTADGTGSAALHQPMDGSGLSAEEERLWSIVTTNSLDFTAWTSLIEETERVSEGNILKIRKVYDTFLAEFPLCYGYWKKYADHEARLSSVDKVAEVYERAIQGVTYSVDMWLHYCVFSISTYGDPEIIRGHLQQQLLKYKV